MQKLFVTFPNGAPGIGLLLLRVAVSITVMSTVPMPAGEWLVLSVCIAVALALFIGVMTPAAAGLVIALELLAALRGGIDSEPIVALAVAQALALALLGPGAYSLDSRLFGRRLIFESRQDGG
jgi:uncharacterized membrane protein YphA (DoxX/SURF4 family)